MVDLENIVTDGKFNLKKVAKNVATIAVLAPLATPFVFSEHAAILVTGLIFIYTPAAVVQAGRFFYKNQQPSIESRPAPERGAGIYAVEVSNPTTGEVKKTYVRTVPEDAI